MSKQQAQWIPLSKKEWVFSWWITTNVSSLYLANNRSPYLRNVRLDWQSITIRPWHNLFATLTSGDYPRGIWTYYRTTASNDRLVVRHNTDATHKLYTIDTDGTATSITTASDIASDNRMTFLNVWDVIYCMNWSDALWKLNGTTYSTISTTFTTKTATTIAFVDSNPDTITDSWSWFLAAWFEAWDVIKVSWSASNDWIYTIDTVVAWTITLVSWDSLSAEWVWASVTITQIFAPSFWVDFSSSFWTSGWSANPNIVYKSVWNNYEDFNSAWSDSFTFNEQIKGLAENDKTLLVFTQNTISAIDLWDFDSTNSRITYNTSSIQAQEWTKVHKSIVTVWVNTYFLSSSNKILRVLRWANMEWFEIQQLSHRKYAWIDEIMETLDTDQSESFWYFVQDKNLIKWFVKTIDATFNDLCIIYDITKDAFLIDEQKYFYDWVYFKWYNYTISMLEPKVYKDEYSQTDEWTAISFEYHTKDFYITDPTYKKVLREARTLTFINELASLTQEIYADWGLIDTKVIDKDNITVSDWWIWTWAIWTFAIWDDWPETAWDELQEVDILRTAGNLNVIGKKFKFVFRCSSKAAKLRLEDINILVEVKPSISTNLTT